MTAELALRATVILSVASAFRWGLRSMSPAAHHTLWLSSVIATLTLPLASSVSPSWGVVSGKSRPAASVHHHAGDPGSATATWPAGPVRAVFARASQTWLAGSGLVALYFLSGYLRLALLRRRAHRAPPRWQASSSRVGARARLPQPVEVLV